MLISSILIDLLSGRNVPITARNFEALQMETFIFGLIVALLFLLILWIVTELIPYEGSLNDQSSKKRQTAFYIIGALTVVALFSINTFKVSGFINRSGLKSDFIQTNVISVIICAFAYFLIAFGIAKAFPKTKFGTIFSSKTD